MPENINLVHPILNWRYDVLPDDLDRVRKIVSTTGFFRADEIDVAAELVGERLSKGIESGYHFVFAELDQEVVGYASYGPIACTVGSFDLYWIAVDPRFQGRGLGQMLLNECERLIGQAGGRNIFIETSGKPQYAPTRGFYERCGYSIVATLPDFYDVDDDKVVWQKTGFQTS